MPRMTEPASIGILHVALIMDGNGRWAEARGLPRIEGHRAGAVAVRRVVEAAPSLGIRTLSLFALSSDNWQRPLAEVQALLALLQEYLESETPRCCEKGVRVSVIGSRGRLGGPLRQAIESAEAVTAGGKVLNLRIALDYSSRDAILSAARHINGSRNASRRAFSAALAGRPGDGFGSAEVDLLIRTGGERRLSDFLLWECAYAELYFTETMWPDFDGGALATALRDFHSRERRFGRVLTRTQARAVSVAGPKRPAYAVEDYWLR